MPKMQKDNDNIIIQYIHGKIFSGQLVHRTRIWFNTGMSEIQKDGKMKNKISNKNMYCDLFVQHVGMHDHIRTKIVM